MSDPELPNDLDKLSSAMTGDDKSVLQSLMEDGIDVNYVNNNGESALHIATSLEKEEIVMELLRAGAEPDLQNKNGESALHLVTSLQKEEVVIELLKAGAKLDLHNKNGQTALHLASARGNGDIVGLLLGTNVYIDKKTFYTETTALHLACQNGYTDVVKMLLENGADITILDAIGQPALFYAERHDIVKLLKEHAENLLTERRANIEKERQRRRDLLWMRPPPPYKSSVIHREKFSKRHQKLMKLNVFDRLTRRKSQLP